VSATLLPPEPVTWYGQFRMLLADMLAGGPTLEAMARRLALSPRSLQRRLAEHGTTWRAELDHARRLRAEQCCARARPTMASLARQLGYSDPRSARRALHRLDRTAGHIRRAAPARLQAEGVDSPGCHPDDQADHLAGLRRRIRRT
jgi:AraC-like DNA-binding protein